MPRNGFVPLASRPAWGLVLPDEFEAFLKPVFSSRSPVANVEKTLLPSRVLWPPGKMGDLLV
jgi:hypothetical protein